MKNVSCNDSFSGVGAGPLWASATHWSHRISLFINKVALDNREPDEVTAQAKQNPQAHQQLKSHGQVRRDKQLQRYDVKSIIPFIQQNEVSTVDEKNFRREQHLPRRHPHASIECEGTKQANASRQQLLQRLHAKIDSLKRSGDSTASAEVTRTRRSAVNPNKGKTVRKQKVGRASNLRAPELKTKQPVPPQANETEESQMHPKGDEDDESFSFGDMKSCDEKPKTFHQGKRGDKRRRIDRALRDIKRAKIRADTLGKEEVLRQATDTALKKIRGEKVLNDPRLLMKTQRQMDRKKAASRQAWAQGTYTDLKKQKKKIQKAEEKRKRKEARNAARDKDEHSASVVTEE